MRFECPQCHEIIAIESEDMGHKIQCGNCMNVVNAPAERLSPGAVIGDFLIIEKIGQGGMGIVFRAHQLSLDRPAALKVLSGSHAKNPEFINGFIKEARAAAQLNHPHIVQAFAVGDDDGLYYFAMEYINGETMKAVLRREGYLEVNAALNIIQQIAEALDYAWKEAKLVHRDIKPDNIMMTSNGRAKLADLGLARQGDENAADGKSEVIGTPQYISPEQLTGAPVDTRSDIYSLGATFYHLITGRFPFEGTTALEIAKKHLNEELVPPSELWSSIPENVSLVICKMMAKNVADRYQSPAELIEDLLMVRRGKLPPGVAALHGGGFAGKTLILVNSTSASRHRISPVLDQRPQKKDRKKAFWIVFGIVIFALAVAGIVYLLSRESKTEEPVKAPVQQTFIERSRDVLALCNTPGVPDEEKHQAILQLRRDFPTLHDAKDLRRMDTVSEIFAALDEKMVTAKSSVREQGAKAQKAARDKARE